MKNFRELYREICESAPDRLKKASKSKEDEEIKISNEKDIFEYFFKSKIYKTTKRLIIFFNVFFLLPIFIALVLIPFLRVFLDLNIDEEVSSWVMIPPLLGIIVMCIFFVVSILMSKRKLDRNDALEYKKNVINKIIKNFSEKLEYYPEKGMSEVVYQASGFDKEYKSYYSEDYITGPIFDDCLFSMAEIDVKIGKTIENKSHYYTNRFRGLFVAVYLPKDISAEIEIYERNDFSSITEGMMEDFIEGRHTVKKDKEFEQIYKVTTTNQIQAARLLTLEVTTKLANFYNINEIIPEIAIKNNVLYIRYRIKRVFDPSSLENGMDYYTLKKYYDILKFTIEFTEIFVKSMLEVGD